MDPGAAITVKYDAIFGSWRWSVWIAGRRKIGYEDTEDKAWAAAEAATRPFSRTRAGKP